ncbi:hypothetical protein GGR58DRAFT_138812 [Xylaria digitata]|nr:hypothetical protein GGR58DRAFT_138812 [Xylaria digitata]
MEFAILLAENILHADILHSLGRGQLAKYVHTDEDEDISQAFKYLQEGWESRRSRPYARIKVATLLARVVAIRSPWDNSSALLTEAVKLIPTIGINLLENADRQNLPGDFSGLASIVAAADLNANHSPYHALEVLGLGRGVMANFLLDIRTDISGLATRAPELAREFTSLQSEID